MLYPLDNGDFELVIGEDPIDGEPSVDFDVVLLVDLPAPVLTHLTLHEFGYWFAQKRPDLRAEAMADVADWCSN